MTYVEARTGSLIQTANKLTDWQKAIFGLVLFSVLFAACGTVLTGLGISASFLPKKMYYLHSAGEVCFVAALANGVGLSVYPYTVRKLGYQRHSYGTAYWLGWLACVLQSFAALFLMLDHLVRESSRPRHCSPRRCCPLRLPFERRRCRRPETVSKQSADSARPDDELEQRRQQMFELKSSAGAASAAQMV